MTQNRPAGRQLDSYAAVTGCQGVDESDCIGAPEVFTGGRQIDIDAPDRRRAYTVPGSRAVD